MSTQKKTIKVFMFLLPALITLLGYAAFHDMLFKERPCLINCDSSFSDNEKLKKWLAFLESLRGNPFATDPARKGSSPTALDLAFLQDKFDASNKHGDYFNRYRQIISDLTSPKVVKEVEDDRKSPILIAQLSDPNTTTDTNTQTFVGDQPPLDAADPTFLVGPASTPRTRGPQYFDNSQPPVSGGGSGTGGSESPSNGGPSGGGNTGGGNNPGGGEAPSGGGNTGNNGNGNPISSVPAPKAVYLLLGLILAIVSARFKLYQRRH